MFLQKLCYQKRKVLQRRDKRFFKYRNMLIKLLFLKKVLFFAFYGVNLIFSEKEGRNRRQRKIDLCKKLNILNRTEVCQF